MCCVASACARRRVTEAPFLTMSMYNVPKTRRLLGLVERQTRARGTGYQQVAAVQRRPFLQGCGIEPPLQAERALRLGQIVGKQLAFAVLGLGQLQTFDNGVPRRQRVAVQITLHLV